MTNILHANIFYIFKSEDVCESICVNADQRVLLRCALLTSRTDFISRNGGDQMDAKGMKTKREGFGTNIYLQLKRKNHHF